MNGTSIYCLIRHSVVKEEDLPGSLRVAAAKPSISTLLESKGVCPNTC